MERPTAARFPLPVAWRDDDPTPLLDQYSVLVEQFIAVLPPFGSLQLELSIIGSCASEGSRIWVPTIELTKPNGRRYKKKNSTMVGQYPYSCDRLVALLLDF